MLATLGVFRYGVEDGWAVPYTREAIVEVPVSTDALPPELRTRLERARLPIRFADSPRVAPGAHVPVEAWGPVWQDLDGTW